jgi:antitoxin component YwqK of YwqJK toxin-antitoxin module
MKKISVIILAISFLVITGCSDNIEEIEPSEITEVENKDGARIKIENGKLQNKGHILFFTNGNEVEPLTGKTFNYHKNGQKKLEVNFKNGKRDGLGTLWLDNGQKSSEDNCKDGKLDGLVTNWFDNGQKSSEATYKDGKEYGLVTTWFENGQKSSEAIYKDGKLD